jgi:hypothetical protein
MEGERLAEFNASGGGLLKYGDTRIAVAFNEQTYESLQV